MVIEQQLRGLAAAHRIAEDHRDQMAFGIERRNAGRVDQAMDLGDACMQRDALNVARAQVADACVRRRDHDRSKGSRKDESRAVRADEVDQPRGAGDVSAHRADGFAERALDNVDLALEPLTRHDTRALRAVHADGVHLIDERQRVVALSDVGKLGDRGNVTVHRVDRLERNDAGARGVLVAQQLLEVRGIVVAEDAHRRAAATHALDHRVVVIGVRVDDALGQHAAEHGKGGEVGDPARREEQASFLAMPAGELALERDVHRRGARDIACSTTAGTVGGSLGDGRDDLRVGRHAEVVVRAPDGDRARRTVGRVQHRVGGTRDALDLRERPIAALGLQTLDRVIDDAGVVHVWHSSPTR